MLGYVEGSALYSLDGYTLSFYANIALVVLLFYPVFKYIPTNEQILEHEMQNQEEEALLSE